MRLQSVRAISVAAAAFLVCVACGGTTFASPTVSPAASLGRPTGQPVASVTSQPTGDPAFGGQATAAVVVGGVSHIIDGGRCVSTPDGFVITVGAAQYPIDLYDRWLRRFLAYIVPVAFVAYFPALFILGKPDPLGFPTWMSFVSPAVGLAAALAADAVWRFGVRHYQSAGG